MAERDKNRREGSFRYFAGKIREKSRGLDDTEIYALGAVEELEADCGDDLGDLRRRVVEARDAYEDALDAVADLCEESAERWKSYVEDSGEE